MARKVGRGFVWFDSYGLVRWGARKARPGGVRHGSRGPRKVELGWIWYGRHVAVRLVVERCTSVRHGVVRQLWRGLFRYG